MSDAATGEPQVVVVDDAAELARQAAQRVAAELARVLEARPAAHLALTGGSTAVGLYKELAAGWGDALDWSRVHLWWGDERFVPADHPESNAGLAYATLLSAPQHAGLSGVGGSATDTLDGTIPGVQVRAENVHPFGIAEAAGDSDAAGLVAERYAAELRRYLPTGADGLPRFDVVLLGVGGDGHILSCFPGSAALAAGAPLVLAVPAPEHIGPHLPRVTLSPRLLEPAGLVVVMVAGESKVDAVRRALVEVGPPEEVPARLARRANAVWLLDRAAAAGLDQRGASASE